VDKGRKALSIKLVGEGSIGTNREGGSRKGGRVESYSKCRRKGGGE